MQKSDFVSWTDKLIVFCLWSALVIVPFFPALFRVLPPEKYINPLLLKTIVLRLIALAIIAVWLAEKLFVSERSDQNHPVHPVIRLPVILFLLTGFLSVLFSILPQISFSGERASFAGFQSALLAMIFFWSAFRLETRAASFLLFSLVCSSLLISAFGVLEFHSLFRTSSFQTLGRLESTFSSPISFGAYLSLVFPVTGAFLLSRLLTKKNFLPVFAALVLSLTTLVLTLTLSAWIACLGGLTLFVFLAWRSSFLKRLSRPTTLLTLGLILFLVITLFFFPPTVLKNKQNSLQGRLIIWKIALRIVRDHPLLGSGQDTFLFLVPHYQETDWKIVAPVPSSTRFAHNQFLQTAATQGTLGILALTFIIILGVLSASTRLFGLPEPESSLTIVFICGIFSHIVYSLFAWSDLDITIIFWIILGLVFRLLYPHAEEITAGRFFSFSMTREPLNLFFGLLVLLLVANSLWSGSKTVLAEHYFSQSLRFGPDTSRQAAVSSIKKALRLDPSEWRYRLLLARFYSLPPLNRINLERSREELTLVLKINPYDYDALNLMVVVLREEERLGLRRQADLERYLNWGKKVYPLHPVFSDSQMEPRS